MIPVSQVSAYEKVRLDNIRRNEQYLEQIGLASVHSAIQDTHREQTQRAKAARGNKRRGTTPLAEDEPRRRSSRIAHIPTPSLDLDIAGIRDDDDDEGGGGKRRTMTNYTPAPRAAPTANSTRSLEAQLPQFLGATLGTLMPSLDFGKRAVMVLSNGGSEPKFSKYAGVVEWRNCLYLWVNIAGKDGYTNSFQEAGRYITWYGGSKMRAESDVGKRILRAGPASAASSETVVLFARLPNEPYTCLGRLGVKQSFVDRHPIKVEFELLDFAHASKQQQFQKILRENKR